ncbi:sensor histidine kinase [Solimonas terrae]|uniref:histidine kinase n=1 Tax=Solimonas terrae TaxID=1396819 RepID=A0A6M2BN50_9GAMM|nr:ATP-binding protein [Solimonas terrae]NGY03497.1 hypothetical protein [Solimonas terrae]
MNALLSPPLMSALLAAICWLLAGFGLARVWPLAWPRHRERVVCCALLIALGLAVVLIGSGWKMAAATMTIVVLLAALAMMRQWRREVTSNAVDPSPAAQDHLRQELLLHEASEKRLRNALQQYKRSAADFEQFAYAASHDLQTPLHNIEGFARLLDQRYGETLDSDARSFVAQIRQGVQQTQKLVDALLQLSRIGRRDARIEMRPLDEAFAQAREQLASEIAQLDAQIIVPELPVIEADHALLAQLFQNLIANALKYQPAGRVPRLAVRARAERDEWHFTFTDNGIGIPAEQVDHVFAPFHRLHAQADYSGTGMGLAICRKIAAYHDGEIWAEPHDGGAQIHLLLPTRARPQGAAANSAGPQQRGS